MAPRFSLLLALAQMAVGIDGLRAAPPEAAPGELPRIPPVEAASALGTFEMKPGFRLELVAAEPLIRDPIDLAFDANGRMYVVEMIDYSELRDAQPHLGRIRWLEDVDEDGRFDRSGVFADDLPWPTAVFCANGGVYAAATPDIYFLKDTDGDGVADVREVVFTGFAIDYAPYATNQLNMQAMLNSFRWGLDNRIHGATAPNGGSVSSPRHPGTPPVSLRGRDFAFDPRAQRLSAEAGGGQYGMHYNDRGQRFACNNSDHIRAFMYDLRYAGRNPYFPMPPALVSIAVDGPAAEVFRISPDEPWRVLRTKWRVAGLVPGPIEGGGRASGYFTSATGLAIYRGDAWPEEYVGDAFIADCGSNLIHRKKVRPDADGIGLRAERPGEEQKTEFMRSRDVWFRPVQLCNAPDGTLYVIDMYREIIEHPWSLPPGIKEHLDLNSGNDRGRIYRIVPEGFRQRPLPRLGAATTLGLVQTLEHRNAWHRETAARLLYERQDGAAVPALIALLERSSAALGRLHALYALAGQSALQSRHLLAALSDPDECVREHAIRLAEPFLAGDRPNADKLETELLRRVADPAPRVRYQLAFTLGEMRHSDRIQVLAALARRDAASSWARAAVLSSLAEGTAEMFRAVAGWFAPAASPAPGPAEHEFLRHLVQVIGARNQSNEVGAVLEFVGRAEPGVAFTLVHALGEGLQRARAPLVQAPLESVFARASQLATNLAAAETTRVQAVELLGLTSYAAAGEQLLALLDLSQPQPVQLAAVRTLGRFAEPAVGGELVQRWAGLTPRLREEVLPVLLARPERALALLGALAEESVRRTDLTSVQVDFLMNHREARIRQEAIRLLARQTEGEREALFATYRPALELAGEPANGKRIFDERCASCHRLQGEGYVLGPDLVSVKNTGKEKMLISIIDPNREVLPQYVAYEIETRDDESLMGFVAGETAGSVTLHQAYGKETTVLRENIASMRSQGRSLMPEGLEAMLSPQEMADLLEYIMGAQ